MTDLFCACCYKSYAMVNAPLFLWSTVLELIFSVMIIVCGEIINYRFLSKLKKEKRRTPIGRKGNVIEPIMRWYCKLQMIYWPYHLIFFWIMFNEIIPYQSMNGWWCSFATFILVRFGRMCIAWNSAFVALIRYLYTVHRQKSNQWEFENVGRYFSISSIVIPIGIETVGLFVSHYPDTQITTAQDVFKSCVTSLQNLNNTVNIQNPEPYFRSLTLQFVPEWIILGVFAVYFCLTGIIFINLLDGIVYFQIFRTIKRCNNDSYTRGVLSKQSYIRGNERGLISIQMCFMAWLYELLSIFSSAMSPVLLELGVPNVHLFDAIIMFLVIPFLHLMNDEDTKAIIYEESWYQGLRNMFGIYNEKVPQREIRWPPSVADPKNNPSHSHNEPSKHLIHTTSSQNRFLSRRCNSASILVPPKKLEGIERNDLLQRRYSLRCNITNQGPISFQDPIIIYLIKSIKATPTNTSTTMLQGNYPKECSGKGSTTSIDTIYLDK